ncbi:MAG: hypothetical protein JWQ30_1851 [Sediminibacterium sp.]|nr:hypothetical protein [Sediminibacterium sp.]
MPERSLNLVDGGTTTICTEYYWITYDPETGAIYSADYLYTECIEYSDGGSSGGGSGEEEIPTYYTESIISNDSERIDDESEIGDNPDGGGAGYDIVMWEYRGEIERESVGRITFIVGVQLWDTKVTNTPSPYVDVNGNTGGRTISLSNQTNSWSWFVPTQLVKIRWKCDALGQYASPGRYFTKFWTHTKEIISA